MKELLIEKLYDFWSKILLSKLSLTDDDKETLLKEITQNVNDGISGVEVLLDWCRNDYDMIKEQYRKLHNLTYNEMDKIMEENCGTYEFMYDEIPYAIDLQDIWDLCNWYLDFLNGSIITEKWLEEMI